VSPFFPEYPAVSRGQKKSAGLPAPVPDAAHRLADALFLRAACPFLALWVRAALPPCAYYDTNPH